MTIFLHCIVQYQVVVSDWKGYGYWGSDHKTHNHNSINEVKRQMQYFLKVFDFWSSKTTNEQTFIVHIVEERHDERLGDKLSEIFKEFGQSEEHQIERELFQAIIDSIMEVTVLMMNVEGGSQALAQYLSMRINNAFFDKTAGVPVFSYHHINDAFVHTEETEDQKKKTNASQLLTIIQGILNLLESFKQQNPDNHSSVEEVKMIMDDRLIHMQEKIDYYDRIQD